MTKADWKPVALEGRVVRLEPLRRDHGPALWHAQRDHIHDLFRWIPFPVLTESDSDKWMDTAFAEQERGESLVFVTVERSSSRVIGSTRYMNINRANRRAEIGSTWIAPAWQRTAVNTEAKYMMLRHAFEEQNCIRVELKTDKLNQKSRNAILRIGAKEEGTFRRHLITSTGRVRDTVYFSILDSEWPEVKAKLEERLITLPHWQTT